MKISASILDTKEKSQVDELNNTDVEYIHIDVMDNIFVPNTSKNYNEYHELLVDNKKPLDIHLMVNDIYKYINKYQSMNPEFITFHYEATRKVEETINYIKSKNIKVGMSIKPNTELEDIYNYLDKLDLVLIMSVEPGFGGQTFISKSVEKINRLLELKKEKHYNYVIEVDGGINDETIKLIHPDNERIEKLKR